MKTRVKYQWKRYWVPQGENPSIMGGFFIEPPPEILWFGPKSNGVLLPSLEDVPCLVLLGDVGMGKSTTLAEEARAFTLTVQGKNHAVVYQDLRRFSEQQIYRRVFEHPDVVSWARGQCSLTLFLDSLDECWRRIEELQSILVGELEARLGQTKQPLFLRLTCRSAEWRAETALALQNLFNRGSAENPVQAFVLAPLSEANVEAAAEAHGLSGTDFVEAVGAKQVQALASHPITLEMLLSIYLEGKELPKSRASIYEMGCLHLCTDRHIDAPARKPGLLTPLERLCVASRLAALSVLTNRYLINPDPERPQMRLDVLEAMECAGYHQERMEGEPLVVDREGILSATQTALFADVREGLQAWRHQSYAEFLAARYLAQSSLPVAHLVPLLIDTTSNSRRVVPQLEETVSWLAAIRREVFDALVESNADLFIRCDPQVLDPRMREQLVQSYLGLVRNHEALELDWHLRNQFANLEHPRLADQLRPIIAADSEEILVREMAIDIAAYCRCRGLADELVQVFLNSKMPIRLRKQAGYALQLIADGSVRAAIKQKSDKETLEDPWDDLKGYYLRILWPSHLTIDEVLALLTPPKKRNVLGTYRHFLEYEFLKKISDSDLPALLQWLEKEAVSFDILGPYGHFPALIAKRALESIEDRPIRPIVFRILRKLSAKHQMHQFFKAGYKELTLAEAARRAFWNAALEEGSDAQRLTSEGGLAEAGILRGEDIQFFISRYTESLEDHAKAFWLSLAFCAFDPSDQNALDHLSALASGDPVAAKHLSARTSCAVLPDNKNWTKQAYLRERERTAAKETHSIAEFEKRIDKCLQVCEQGNQNAFWHLLEMLQTNPEEPDDSPSWNIRLSAEKGWISLHAELQLRILQYASRYLLDLDVVESNLHQEEGAIHMPYHVVQQILVLFFDVNKERLASLPAAAWERIAPVLFFYYDTYNGSHDGAYDFIFSLCFEKAEDKSLQCLAKLVEQHINHDNKRRLIRHMNVVWSEKVGALFRGALKRSTIKPLAASDILCLFIAREPGTSLPFLRGIFEGQAGFEDQKVPVSVAGALLWANWPENVSQTVLARLNSEPALGKEILWLLLRVAGDRGAWLSRLQPDMAADLWDWLVMQFPGDPWIEEDGSATFTPRHDMYEFRNAVLENLKTRGTVAACRAMEGLMRKRPQDFWLGDLLAEMRKSVRRVTWATPAVKALLQSLANSEGYLVRTAGELQLVLLESLKAYEKGLRGTPPSQELWNAVGSGKGAIRDPKDEGNLSTCLKLHFDRDLKDRAIIFDREVQIRPGIGPDPAQLTDLLVTAVPFNAEGAAGNPVCVVIEAKGAWNDGVLSDMETQLCRRYMQNSQIDFGIYVVGYFTCEAWSRSRDRRKESGASKMDISELQARLSEQAKSLSSLEKRLEAVVLDARLNLRS